MKRESTFSLFLLLSAVLFYQTTLAQWSVKEGDPRIEAHKNESFLYQVFTTPQWHSSNFATPQQIKWFNDARYGMFIHFGLNSYVNKDMSWPIVYNRKAPDRGHGDYPDSAWQKTWPSLFKLEKFNAKEWIKIAQNAGFKYIVIITKHHDGFHMWDTKFSDFKITNTPFKRDYIRELVNACREAKMPVGFYYSQRDWYHPDYAPIDTATSRAIASPPFYEALPGKEIKPGPTHQKYIEYQFNVVRELCTQYGKIDIFWFDAAWFGGMFTANMWNSEPLTRMIRQLQPGIIINNRASVPGDFDTPEQRMGMYQSRSWESAMTLNGSWGYHPAPIRSAKELIGQMLIAAAGNGNVLLSWGAHFNGAFDAAQKDTLLKVGEWLTKYGQTYYGTRGGPWSPIRNFGAVHKGSSIFLYVFNWPSSGLALPVLADNTIASAAFVNVNEALHWQKEQNDWVFHKPAEADDIVTIIELKMKKPVNEKIVITRRSTFDDPVYGEKLLERSIDKNSWQNGQYIVAFPEPKSITGIAVNNASGTLEIFTSTDGKKWDSAGSAKEGLTDLSITDFKSGAQVPGRLSNFVKLQTKNAMQVSVKIYAKK